MYSTGIAYLLWLVSGFGALGFHRFYLGKIPTGLLWMFTGGLAGIGSIYDLVTLGGQVKKANIERALLSGAGSAAVYNAAFEHGRQVASAGGGFIDGMISGAAGGGQPPMSVEQSILKTAKQNNGVLTPSEVALGTGLPLDQAKKALDDMVTKGYAELRVKKSGGLAYIIPDIMDSSTELEDF